MFAADEAWFCPHSSSRMPPTLAHCVLKGQVPYLRALDLQLRTQQLLLSARGSKSPPVPAGIVFLLEHPHVYTVGRSCRWENNPGLRADFEADEKRLRAMPGVEFHHTLRGGKITYHGPGQLAGYPIVDLRKFGITLREYVGKLERSVVRYCVENHGVAQARAGAAEGFAGVWVGNSKLCAIGVQASSFVTTHGFALNVDPDMRYFEQIVPCGLLDRQVTSLAREASSGSLAWPDVVRGMVDSFGNEWSGPVRPLAENYPELYAILFPLQVKGDDEQQINKHPEQRH